LLEFIMNNALYLQKYLGAALLVKLLNIVLQQAFVVTYSSYLLMVIVG